MHFLWQGAALGDRGVRAPCAGSPPRRAARYADRRRRARRDARRAHRHLLCALECRHARRPTSVTPARSPPQRAIAARTCSSTDVRRPAGASRLLVSSLRCRSPWSSRGCRRGRALRRGSLGGWLVARRLCRQAVRPGVTPTSSAWPLASPIGSRLGAARARPRVVAVSVPVMVGWLKPVVLVPAAALCGPDARAARGAARARAGARAAPRLSRQPAPVDRRDAALLSPGGLVGVAPRARRARTVLRRPGGWRLRPARLCERADRSGRDDDATPRLALAATDGPLLRRVRRILDDAREDSAGSGWTPALVTIVLLGLGVGSVVLASTRPPIQNASVASGILAERGSFVRPATGEVVTATRDT